MYIIEFKDVSHKDILHNITGYFREGRITTFRRAKRCGEDDMFETY